MHPLADLVLRSLADLEPERDVAEHRQVLERRVVLEHEADVAPLRGQRRSRPRPSIATVPASGCSSPAMIRSRVDLPPPLGPSSAVSGRCGTSTDRRRRGDEVAEPLGDVRYLDAHAGSSRRQAACVAQQGHARRCSDGMAISTKARRTPDLVEVLEALLDEAAVRVWVCAETLPDTTATAPYSPSERARREHDAVGERASGSLGSVIRRNVCHRARAERPGRLFLVDADLLEDGDDLAHDQRAATRRRSPGPCPGPRRSPGCPRRRRQPPTSRCARRTPGSSARPTTTGETDSGRSMQCVEQRACRGSRTERAAVRRRRRRSC